MSSVFSQIIKGELPAYVIWREDDVVAFLTIAPLRPGHVLVVPRQEIDLWTEAEPELLNGLMAVAQAVGRAQQRAWGAPRAGLAIAGFEIPHLHVHVTPIWDMSDLDLTNVDHEPNQSALADSAGRLRAALRELGHGMAVPTG
ncbi:HIT family protein [Streptosporangium sp. V21-05]|uniref:HIT family protein n=1 Tax=Streptosporangium sp. V21-05 TaxID=3446115 RepID=UPI003F53AF3C